MLKKLRGHIGMYLAYFLNISEVMVFAFMNIEFDGTIKGGHYIRSVFSGRLGRILAAFLRFRPQERD